MPNGMIPKPVIKAIAVKKIIGEVFKMKRGNVLLIMLIVFLIGVPLELSAKVSGVCSNCHTMHNSQDGTQVAVAGEGMGWTGDGGVLTGGSSSGPQGGLLITNCVGCHSSTSADTVITVASSDIPIVYNTSEPSTPLAGGNFYWVAQGDDSKGHNVYGIAGPDSLSAAPGRYVRGCGNSCHTTLADPPASNNSNRGGCEGCHVFTYHHEDNGVYRFLKGHWSPELPIPSAYKEITTYEDYVLGKEDGDWEYTTDGVGDHNYYKGTDDNYSTAGGEALRNKKTITSFCAGCHGKFHGPRISDDGMGSEGAWIRHPTDKFLPDSEEYGNYDPDVPANYSVEAPVAWIDPENPVRAEAVVMCLSCHRPHGSPYSDLLRWDYDDMEAGTADPDKAGKGCFTCHTEKDGIL
jgi:predicted CXXCH cytochrome family protein